jgi:tellurium resistance protein TerZ
VVELRLGWNFPEDELKLDASCLFFSRGEKVGHVDYKKRTDKIAGRAVTHSGDKFDYKQKSGEHTIAISLLELPKSIDCMYLVLSAVCFCGVRGCEFQLDLSTVMNPFVSIVERQTNTELCSYTLAKAGTSNSVIMAKVVRQLSGWKVVPVGATSKGNSAKYGPILDTIMGLERGKEQ